LPRSPTSENYAWRRPASREERSPPSSICAASI
jgi:hypothetical protein